MTYRTEWEHVPDVQDTDGLEVDPHWLALQQGSGLPTSYMPTSVPGAHRPWQRVTAIVVLVMLLAVTASGICLTYGPHELFRFLES